MCVSGCFCAHVWALTSVFSHTGCIRLIYGQSKRGFMSLDTLLWEGWKSFGCESDKEEKTWTHCTSSRYFRVSLMNNPLRLLCVRFTFFLVSLLRNNVMSLIRIFVNELCYQRLNTQHCMKISWIITPHDTRMWMEGNANFHGMNQMLKMYQLIYIPA